MLTVKGPTLLKSLSQRRSKVEASAMETIYHGQHEAMFFYSVVEHYGTHK